MWNEVDFPLSWHFSDDAPPTEQTTQKTEKILQFPDGGSSLTLSDVLGPIELQNINPHRLSGSSITIKIEEGFTSSNTKNNKLFGVGSHIKTFTQPY